MLTEKTNCNLIVIEIQYLRLRNIHFFYFPSSRGKFTAVNLFLIDSFKYGIITHLKSGSSSKQIKININYCYSVYQWLIVKKTCKYYKAKYI